MQKIILIFLLATTGCAADSRLGDPYAYMGGCPLGYFQASASSMQKWYVDGTYKIGYCAPLGK